MVKANEVYSSLYIAASDLGGKTYTLEVSGAEVAELRDEGDTKKQKLVLSFKGARKKLVVNFTNYQTIKPILGDDTDKWIGHSLVIATRQVPFKGKMGPAVRVLDVVLNPKLPKPNPTEGATDAAQTESSTGL